MPGKKKYLVRQKTSIYCLNIMPHSWTFSSNSSSMCVCVCVFVLVCVWCEPLEMADIVCIGHFLRRVHYLCVCVPFEVVDLVRVLSFLSLFLVGFVGQHLDALSSSRF